MPSSEVMHKFGSHTLHSGGPGGPKVTNQKQAVAIMLSEKRKEAAHGGHYPESHFGGGTMGKSSGLHDAGYAKGGSVLPRKQDWAKDNAVPRALAINTREDKAASDTYGEFLGGVDRFTSANLADSGEPANLRRTKPDEDWSKGNVSEKGINKRSGDSKTEKPIKPRQ